MNHVLILALLGIFTRSLSYPSTLWPRSFRIEAHNTGGHYHFTTDGRRHVKAYVHTYSANCKGRWVGQKLLDVFASEFTFNHSRDYLEKAIQNGLITVNDEVVLPGTLLAAPDVIKHVVHRHEPPVLGALPGQIKVLAENEHLLVVGKPSTLPVHPAGEYTFNSLTHILQSDREGDEDASRLASSRVESDSVLRRRRRRRQPLLPVHRLDRLTSGVTILAKSKEAARRFSEDLQSGATKKTYLARVVGDFGSTLDSSPVTRGWQRHSSILEGDPRALGWAFAPSQSRGEAEGPHQPPSSTLSSSTSSCSSSNNNNRVEVPRSATRTNSLEQTAPSSSVNAVEGGQEVPSSWVRIQQPIACTSRTDGGYTCPFAEPHTRDDGQHETPSRRPKVIPPSVATTATAAEEGDGSHLLRVRVAATLVRKVSFNGQTSLVEVVPLHGRTHQIRLHLRALGHPIANDPFYGPGDAGYNGGGGPSPVPLRRGPLRSTHADDGEGSDDPLVEGRREGESVEEFAVRACRVCREERDRRRRSEQRRAEHKEIPGRRMAGNSRRGLESKSLLREYDDDNQKSTAASAAEPGGGIIGGGRHAEEGGAESGIWLHAYRYERKRRDSPELDWSFETSLPSWALD